MAGLVPDEPGPVNQVPVTIRHGEILACTLTVPVCDGTIDVNDASMVIRQNEEPKR